MSDQQSTRKPKPVRLPPGWLRQELDAARAEIAAWPKALRGETPTRREPAVADQQPTEGDRELAEALSIKARQPTGSRTHDDAVDAIAAALAKARADGYAAGFVDGFNSGLVESDHDR